MTHPTFELENKAVSKGKIIAGIDEVGRGCIAGPVYAAVVSVSSKKHYIEGVNDSKLLSAKKREDFDKLIRSNCCEYAIGSASVAEVDGLGIGNAVALAMERAYQQLKKVPDEVIVDGASITRPNIPCTMIQGGDKLHYCISAASVIAKVARDKVMHELAKVYPNYGFENHVGYGTLEHMNAVDKYGVQDIHRRSFSPIKEMVRAKS